MVNDLIGGVKNAMDRGQNMNNIRQSFVNAGYKKEEVEQAIQETNSIYSQSTQQVQVQQAQPTPSPQTTEQQNQTTQPQFQQLPSPVQAQPTEKKSHLWLVLIIVSILILVGAALLGLYWEKIAGLFK